MHVFLSIRIFTRLDLDVWTGDCVVVVAAECVVDGVGSGYCVS